MNWDKLDIHLENLIPGIVLLSLIILNYNVDYSKIISNSVIGGVVFISVGYMLGTIGNITARLLIDKMSELTIRTPMIKLFAKSKIADMKEKTTKSLNARYSFLIDQAMDCGNDIVVKEVVKRRQTGRLLRSSLIPGIFAMFYFVPQGFKVLAVIIAYIFILFLYAYAEVAVFTEAHRGYRIKNQVEKN